VGGASYGAGAVSDRDASADRQAPGRPGGGPRREPSWLYKLFARFRLEGPAGLAPRSRRPQRSPTRIADRYEEAIVALGKELVDAGFDAGAETIGTHLARRGTEPPSTSTIWRVLRARSCEPGRGAALPARDRGPRRGASCRSR
jgi:Homeodomain-like domain